MGAGGATGRTRRPDEVTIDGEVVRSTPRSGGTEGNGDPASGTERPVVAFLGRNPGWVLAGVTFVVTAVLSRPAFDSIDSWIMAQVAEGMLHHGTPLVHINLPGNAMRVYHVPRGYADYGLGSSLVWVPFLWVEQVLGLPHLRLVALTAPLELAATVLALFTTATSLGATRRQAVMAAGALGFGTFLLAYGTTFYSEPGVALCVALALLGLSRLRGPAGWAVLVGAAMGASVLFRTDSWPTVVLPLGVGLLALRPPFRRLVAVAGGAAVPLALWGWYNVARFGSLTSSGYPTKGGGFTHPFLDGLVGLLVSPGKGIIWFAPVLVLALWGVRGAYRRWPVLTITSLALVVARFLLYAPWWGWDGGLAFGPRFLIPAVPAMIVPLTALAMDEGRNPRFVRIGAVLVAWGCVVALLGAVSYGSWGVNAPAGSWQSNPVVIVIRSHLPGG